MRSATSQDVPVAERPHADPSAAPCSFARLENASIVERIPCSSERRVSGKRQAPPLSRVSRAPSSRNTTPRASFFGSPPNQKGGESAIALTCVQPETPHCDAGEPPIQTYHANGLRRSSRSQRR